MNVIVEKYSDRGVGGIFLVERLDCRTIEREGFYKGLARNGPKAVREFDEVGL